ncbi:MAG: hypothetical protein K9G76_09475 [Bacteroidales bacterium]|nr:hypothetical protein [Bacteroidales bacterium]MCF8406026.1 hypothetical protein [Bacteroidales bacterium]
MRLSNLLLSILLIIVITGNISAQGVSISEDGADPDGSAMLDIQSSTKGLLIPRVSFVEMYNISNPAVGLLVFCTSFNKFYFYVGGVWKEVGGETDDDWTIDGNDMYSNNSGYIGIGTTNVLPTHKLTIENAIGSNVLRLVGDGTYGENAKINFGDGDYVYIHEVYDDILAIGANNGIGLYSHQDISIQSNYSNINLYTAQGSVAVFDFPTTPEESAILDVSSDSKGMLIPRMTTGQITAINDPADGLQVYNTTEGRIYIFVATDNCWREVSYGTGAIYFQTFENCGDDLTDTRDGQTYATVDINGQCWMAENLNYGTMINTGSYQNNNGIPEKYCLNNSTAFCDELGGLYQWNEMMNYNSTAGGQGICPDGWHVPTDAEWYALENFVDPSINNPNATGWRGNTAGQKLKSSQSGGSYNWANTMGTDDYGFTARPSGYRNTSGYSSGTTQLGTFWTSDYAIDREMYYTYVSVFRSTSATTTMGLGVRCLKD